MASDASPILVAREPSLIPDRTEAAAVEIPSTALFELLKTV